MGMKIIEHRKIKIKELVKGYQNNEFSGQVITMNGRLNVRPAYQREFVWDKGNTKAGKKKQALIDSIINGYPINVMYWIKTGKNLAGEDMYECLDGQQRIITICSFKENMFGMEDGTQFDGLSDNTKFLDYDNFIVYICEADTIEEKLAWFERINTGGEPLSKQEMRSAVACGEGTTLAKKFFVSKKNQSGTSAYSYDGQAGNPARDYLSGEWDRQDIYEKVLTWYINSRKEEKILAYMKNNRNNTDEAENLFEYFKNVIKWVKTLFPTYYKDMKKVEWGFLFNKYHTNITLSSDVLEKEIKFLRADVGRDNNSHLESTKGIYEYVLEKANGNDNPKLLQRRTFNKKDIEAQYERQRHVCPHCRKRFEKIEMMCGDHIIPYSPIPKTGIPNGPTTPENLQILCHNCNQVKRNLPFDKDAEEQKLQEIYSMSDAEISLLPEGRFS